MMGWWDNEAVEAEWWGSGSGGELVVAAHRVKGDRLVDLESAGAARGTRLEVRDLVTLNSTRVVVESDHRVLRVKGKDESGG